MLMIRGFTFAVMLVLTVACASTKGAAPAGSEPFSFVVIGDIPYSDDDTAFLVNEIIPAIRDEKFPFVIHLGDYKGGGTPCAAEFDEAQLSLIAALTPSPVFYTPGDNEVTDCDRFDDPATGAPQSELARLQRVRDLFFTGEPVAPAEMEAAAQPLQRENLTWRYRGVRFVNLHIVATNNGRNEVAGDDPALAATAADQRDIANLAWLLEVVAKAKREDARALVITFQADVTEVSADLLGKPCKTATASRTRDCDGFAVLRPAIRNAALAFGGPTLVIHGDTSAFSFGRSFAGAEAANLWRLNAAGDYGRTAAGPYGVQDATLVTIDLTRNAPFAAEALVTGVAPDAD